jgi:predicted nucleic acid-binding protein
MGQLIIPNPSLIYVDTEAWIYKIEKVEPFLSASIPVWQALRDKTAEVITSELTLLETLVKPIREKNHEIINLYRNVLLSSRGVAVYPISRVILEEATQIRASHNLKTPDAIHAATALLYHCNLFVTNDPVFKRVPGLNAVILDEVAKE